MTIQFTAVFRKVPEGYVGFVEELPGANTQGATLAEARANLVDVVFPSDLLVGTRRGKRSSLAAIDHMQNRISHDDLGAYLGQGLLVEVVVRPDPVTIRQRPSAWVVDRMVAQFMTSRGHRTPIGEPVPDGRICQSEIERCPEIVRPQGWNGVVQLTGQSIVV